MEHTHLIAHLADTSRRGPRTQRPVLHAVLGWHAADLAWLTREHLAVTVEAALAAMGLAQNQAAWVAHTDTGRPHVHVVANLVHPVTGDVARLGLVKKRVLRGLRTGFGRCEVPKPPRAEGGQREPRTVAASPARKAGREGARQTKGEHYHGG